jgi:PDDEXK-like domain of unknown function (DUF3799)
MKITEPGIYPDMASADYFADPCPMPSLTQSIAKILLDQSPLHAWHAHPRLNPDWQPDDPTKFDVGNVAHNLMIGRGKEIVVLDAFDDWRTKEAKAKREEAQAAGKLAVLGKHFAKADRMVRAAREQLELRDLDHLFRDGAGEVVTAWKEPSGFWCRQMIDWLSPDGLTFVDYKSTDMSVAAHGLGRMMSNAGWHIQAAMGERGLSAIKGANLARCFLFVVQETDVPYALNVVALTAGPMTMGRKMLETAFGMWGSCLAHDRWPGYPLEIVKPEFPGWAEQQWLDREIHEAAKSRAPVNVLLAG